MFAYQKTNRYFAQVAPGIEPLAAKELEAFGAKDIKNGYRGLFFQAARPVLYTANYQSRFCSRILAPLLRFDCHSSKYLYKTARKINWQEILSPDLTFAVSANVANSRVRHSQYAALCIKDAVADFFSELAGRRPDVDRLRPDVRLHLHLENNKATVYLDTSGGAMHRRGYRSESVEAPLQETVAAAIISYSGWDGATPLYDPFCGSGTLLLEALMQYCRIPAGWLRREFGFMRLPDYDKNLWCEIKKATDGAIRTLPKNLISGSDIDPGAVKAARANAKLLPGGDHIEIRQQDFTRLEFRERRTIICNPPYGIRLKKKGGMESLLEKFGEILKQRCPKSSAYIFLGKKELALHLHLRAKWKKSIRTGGLDGVLLRYDMF